MKLKKMLAGFMTLCMLVTAVPVTAMAETVGCTATNCEHKAAIGTTHYDTMKEAVGAANVAEGDATITLLDDVTLGEKLTISNDVTIEGEHTITRGTEGTMFAVDKNTTLTLDGGLVIDGGNDWTFDSENFYNDLENFATTGKYNANGYSTSAEGGIEATAAMITISGTAGTVVMKEATIQNNWANNHNNASLFSVPAGATLTMEEGAVIDHIRGSVAGQLKGTWTMDDGEITGVHGHSTNGCLTDIRGGTFTVNDGKIYENTLLGLNNNGSGILAQVYGTSSKLIVNGGKIYDNATFDPCGGWGSVVYLNSGGNFEMNGGKINGNDSDKCTTIGVNNPSSTVELNEGTINVTKTLAGNYDSLVFGDVTIGKNMTINGGDVRFCGSKDNSLVIEGTINSNVLLRAKNVTNNGVVNGDIIVTADSWAGFDGAAEISGGTWNGNFTVADGASLTITGGTFKQNVSQWLEEGYTLVDNGDGTYGVISGDVNVVAIVKGEYFEDLAKAVEAANVVEGGATITLLDDVTLGEKLTISNDVTIKGDYSIKRDSTYTGTLFAVAKEAKLTLDGGLTINGMNNWNFDQDSYDADLDAMTKVAKEDSAKYFESYGPVADAFMMTVGEAGTLNLKEVTIKNHYSVSSGVVKASKDAVVKLDGAEITHCAATQGNGVVVHAEAAGIKVTIEDGTVIDGNHVGGNHGLFKVYSGATLTMNGGEIKNTTGWNSNGTVVGVWCATFNMKDGLICSNSGVYGPSNGRNAAIYIHRNSSFTMEGGTICHNAGRTRGGIDAPYSSVAAEEDPSGNLRSDVYLKGGSVLDNISISGGSTPDVMGGEYLVISGGTYTQDVTQWLADGYALVDNGDGTYGVEVDEKAAVVEMDGEKYLTIKDALWTLKSADTTTHTLKVLKDHEIDVNYSTYNYPILINGFSVVLDLNGHTITADWSKYTGSRADNALIGVCNGGKLTVIDSSAEGTGKIVNNDTKDNVENRIFWIMTGTATKELIVNIEGGTFIQNDVNTALLYIQGNGKDSTDQPVTVNINGGHFETVDDDFFNAYDGFKYTAVINGGTFSKDPTDHEIKIADGYEAIQLAVDKWGIAKKLDEGQTGYTIIYTDGVDNEVVFEDQVKENVVPGTATPTFTGTPVRSGYEFAGWSPKVAEFALEDRVYTAQWTANDSGEDSSPSTSSSKKSSKKYDIDVEDTENGTVKANSTKAKKGATVTITVTPDAGYELDKLIVLDKDGNEVELTDKGNGKFTFKMPRGGVEVEASFEKGDGEPAVDGKEENVLILTIDQVIYQLNGEYLVNDVAPIIRGDRTMLPIRLIAEFLGATVTWNEADQSVTIVKGDTTIVIYIGQEFALVNGEPVQLDEAAFIENDRTYLPLRFIVENLGATVIWDGASRTVTVIG